MGNKNTTGQVNKSYQNKPENIIQPLHPPLQSITSPSDYHQVKEPKSQFSKYYFLNININSQKSFLNNWVKSSMATNLNLNYDKNRPPFYSLRTFNRKLSQLRNVKHISISSSYQFIKGEYIKYWNKLQSLEVKVFIRTNQQNNKEIIELGKALNRQKRIQNLSIEVKNIESVQLVEENYHQLPKILQNQNELTQLALNLSHTHLSGSKFIEDISFSISKLAKLQKITLIITGNFKNEYILVQLMKGIGELKYLKHLIMNASNQGYINNRGILSVGEAIKKLKHSIQSINLDFSECQALNDNCFSEFQHFTQGCTEMKSFSIQLFSTQINHEAPKDLGYAVTNMKNLKELSIDCLYCTHIQSSSASILFNYIAKLKLLQHLKLYFGDCYYIDKNCLWSLGQAIRKLDKIVNLCFIFRNCGNIDANGLNLLYDGFSKLNNLVDLDLQVWNCSKVTDEAIPNLCQLLQEKFRKKMRKLILNFSLCQIGDKSIGLVANTVIAMESLKTCMLAFEKCFGLTDEGVQFLEFVKLREDIPNLQVYARVNKFKFV